MGEFYLRLFLGERIASLTVIQPSWLYKTRVSRGQRHSLPLQTNDPSSVTTMNQYHQYEPFMDHMNQLVAIAIMNHCHHEALTGAT